MDPELMKGFYTRMNNLMAVGAEDAQLATARQRDGAAFDMRGLGAAVATSLLQGDDPAQFAGLNSAVRIPTTLDHPNAKVGT